MKIVVTGAAGFLGRHVLAVLGESHAHDVAAITRATSRDELRTQLADCDAVIHLAGIHRPVDDAEFVTGNVDLTREIVEALREAGRHATVAFASSSRVVDDTPYARTKRAAELLLEQYARDAGARVAIHRLPNVFGKWSRPFFNSAIATFCHSIARDEPVDVHDPARELTLVYGEDVARALVADVTGEALPVGEAAFPTVGPRYVRALGDLVTLIRQFRALRTDLMVPDFNDDFTRKLYGTYVSFLPFEHVSYSLRQFSDQRGTLAELLKSASFGQMFLSRTRPGFTRGQHFHHTKSEKFVVVEGKAVIRFRPIAGDGVEEVIVCGDEFRVVDIPTGYTHSITNIGETDLVTLFWASEIFDPSRSDTYPLEV